MTRDEKVIRILDKIDEAYFQRVFTPHIGKADITDIIARDYNTVSTAGTPRKFYELIFCYEQGGEQKSLSTLLKHYDMKSDLPGIPMDAYKEFVYKHYNQTTPDLTPIFYDRFAQEGAILIENIQWPTLEEQLKIIDEQIYENAKLYKAADNLIIGPDTIRESQRGKRVLDYYNGLKRKLIQACMSSIFHLQYFGSRKGLDVKSEVEVYINGKIETKEIGFFTPDNEYFEGKYSSYIEKIMDHLVNDIILKFEPELATEYEKQGIMKDRITKEKKEEIRKAILPIVEVLSGSNCIIHGDISYRNMKVRYDPDKYDFDVKLIDFKHARVADMVLDYISLLGDVRMHSNYPLVEKMQEFTNFTEEEKQEYIQSWHENPYREFISWLVKTPMIKKGIKKIEFDYSMMEDLKW